MRKIKGRMVIRDAIPVGDIMDNDIFEKLFKQFGFSNIHRIKDVARIGPLTTQGYLLGIPLSTGTEEVFEFYIYDKSLGVEYAYITELEASEETLMSENQWRLTLYFIQRLLYFGTDDNMSDLLRTMMSGDIIHEDKLIW